MKLNKKPSSKEIAARLAKISVLVADDDHRIGAIVRQVLESLGFKNIHIVHDGSVALKYLRTEKIDMIITDWKMEPMDGISFVKYMRMSDESPNRFIPIIMLTGKAEREDVEVARDVGVTEFVVKPFSAKTLCSRISLVIDNPRSFIMSKIFTGPDRRRRSSLPPDGAEKRKRG